MNIASTSGKGSRSEAALGAGRGQGGLPRILLFPKELADFVDPLGFRDDTFGLTPPLPADSFSGS